MEIGMKERLIGAVVLVVLGIIIIPLFLKGSSPDNGASQSVTLPPSDSTAPQQQYTLALSPATAAAGAALAPAAATAVPQQPVLNPVPVQKPVVHDIPRKPSRVAAQAPAPQGKWVVQAGSYGSEANAGKVVSTLTQQGFHAYISRFSKSGHTFYRVRVGPYADRAAADKAVAAVGRAYHGKAEVVPNS
ncbi:MAG TPA: SPOR domain-containing protein [Gammaproteobacteria bacterium]|nr:SPOR domain-containing protein [Gammaproteobacteria bacterium]